MLVYLLDTCLLCTLIIRILIADESTIAVVHYWFYYKLLYVFLNDVL